MAFSLNSYPIVYRAKYEKSAWKGEYLSKPHKNFEDESKMSESERNLLTDSRNYYPDIPLVNYTTQYGLGCFEGMKALPQKDGGLALFRPDRNAERFYKSMEGLYMPPFPQEDFIKACVEVVKRNNELGFCPKYDAEWEKDSFLNAPSVYLRPFTYAEGGIGVNISHEPWVFIISSTVSAYFSSGNSDAITTERIRATPNGTGWIKAAANYTIAALAKHEAIKAGYMECIFLDAKKNTFIEEGSSCNIFFYLKSGELVTPDLGDTILPGITRSSIIELARDKNVKVSERPISIDEAMDETKECFVCGTAVGALTITSLTHKEKKALFNEGKPGELTDYVRTTLKGIQYGVLPDTKGWLTKVC